jgi:L-lysine 2,3-aminomutase
MDKKPKPSPDSKARAAAIHAEIDRLTSGKAKEKPADEKPADKKKAPLSPRDYIQQYMAEDDKKPGK